MRILYLNRIGTSFDVTLSWLFCRAGVGPVWLCAGLITNGGTYCWTIFTVPRLGFLPYFKKEIFKILFFFFMDITSVVVVVVVERVNSAASACLGSR